MKVKIFHQCDGRYSAKHHMCPSSITVGDELYVCVCQCHGALNEKHKKYVINSRARRLIIREFTVDGMRDRKKLKWIARDRKKLNV